MVYDWKYSKAANAVKPKTENISSDWEDGG